MPQPRRIEARLLSSLTAVHVGMLCVCICSAELNVENDKDASRYFYGYDDGATPETLTRLPDGLLRSSPLHEHSFAVPIVTDWWEEGVPHFVLGGGAVATEDFIRLAPARTLGAHGFAFNEVPCDHTAWELRLRFSIRTPIPIARGRVDQREKTSNSAGGEELYQGGEGMALWYLERPIGDDHQHIPKYAKPKNSEAEKEELLRHNPQHVADLLYDNSGDEDDDDDESDSDSDSVNETKLEELRAERLRRQKEREELYVKIFKRGTSGDDSDLEPRVFGLKFSDFKGLGILMDSVGHAEEDDEDEASKQRKKEGTGGNDSRDAGAQKKRTRKHFKHEPKVTVLLNLPAREGYSKHPATNNFDPKRTNFRDSPVRLQCNYDFRQAPTPHAVSIARNPSHDGRSVVPGTKSGDEEILRRTPELPVELLVRYHNHSLRVALRREDMNRRRVIVAPANVTQQSKDKISHNYSIERHYVETYCGELSGVDLPPMYHFGISASTGGRQRQHQHQPSNAPRGPLAAFVASNSLATDEAVHVDVHDAISFELREVGSDAEAMRRTALEHFDHEKDHQERGHLSEGLRGDEDAGTEEVSKGPDGLK
uniref:Uncharacterized protein n=1 Tax=Trypanosoma congolense (strain IL3000) TaxID=1068625 RepID=G0UQT3_TRYCI|nr:conserved hypothetical protein [Trypanosoma congolense IL3000]